MAILAQFDFIDEVVNKYNAVPFLGYEIVFGLDGQSLLIIGKYDATPVFFTSTSSVLLNAAYTSFYQWLHEYSDEVEKSLAEDAQAEAATERAIARMYDDIGWMAQAEQDEWEYKKARLDRQSGFYGDI